MRVHLPKDFHTADVKPTQEEVDALMQSVDKDGDGDMVSPGVCCDIYFALA